MAAGGAAAGDAAQGDAAWAAAPAAEAAARSTSSAMPDLSSTDVPVLRARVHRRFSAEECAQIPVDALRFRALEQADLDEMVALHTEWFPVTYDENFYQRSVRGDLITMVATYGGGLPGGGGGGAASSSSSSGGPAASSGAPACGAHGAGSAGAGAGQEDIFGMITMSTSCEHHGDDIVSVLGGECSELCHRKARRTGEPGQVAGDAGGSLAYILTLGVVDGFRRRGLAKALLNNSMEHINKNMPHVKAVYLHVVTYNDAAIALYESMQFRRIAKFDKFYQLHGKPYDSFLYARYVHSGRPPWSWRLRNLVSIGFTAAIRELVFTAWTTLSPFGCDDKPQAVLAEEP